MSIKRQQLFATKVAARFARVSPATMKNWHGRGLVLPTVPAVGTGPGTSAGYSFSVAISARVAFELSRAGLSLEEIRGVLRFIAEWKALNGPIPENHVIVTDGHVVYYEGTGPFEVPARVVIVIPIGSFAAELTAVAETVPPFRPKTAKTRNKSSATPTTKRKAG